MDPNAGRDPYTVRPSTRRNRPASDGGPASVQRSYASQLKESEPVFTTYEHLPALPRSDAALTMLRKIASLVKPIMRKRGWRVQVLAEFLPQEQNLLGLNINNGYKICIRLRYHNNPDLFLPLEQLVDTMLHELSHNVWGEHDGRFHALWDELRDEHDVLVRKGYTGEGFLSEGHRLGGRRARPPPQHEMRRLARASAEKRKQQGTLSSGSGRRLGGTPLHAGQDVREVIAGQALLRTTVTKGCGSGRQDAGRLASQPGAQTFKTKAEEDDANDRAISQAIYDLIEEEETAKLNGTFSAAPTDGGLAWDPKLGLYSPDSEQSPSTSNAGPSPLSEEEQMRWALEESMRANGHSDTNGLPPESLASPVSPEQAKQVTAVSRSKLPSPGVKSTAEELEAARREAPEPRPSITPNLNANAAASEPARTAQADERTISPILDLSDPFLPATQWTCGICTCINPLQFLACDACGVERPQSLSQPRAPPGPSTNRTNGVGMHGRTSTRSMPPVAPTRSQRESLGWNCGNCAAFMEHRWWTCSACGVMKGSS